MGAPYPPLRFSYLHQPLESILADATVLAVFGFGREAPTHDDPRYLRVGLQPLTAPAPFEVWRSNKSVASDEAGAIHYAADGDYLYGAIEVDEHEHGGIAEATEHAYRALCDFVNARPYAALLRTWNYMDAINLGDGDAERYRLFCNGRARGMRDRFRGAYPAGTAIGRQDGVRTLQVYWLSAREPGVPVENPRQVSAYRYPRQYGPTPPAFARAMLSPATQLLVSGTASVVGHASRHVGDPVGQFDETVRNLDSLLRAAGVGPLGGESLLKLYVRHPAQLPDIGEWLPQRIPGCPALILAGDVCRSELLLEIDCMHG
ncbi:MAG TPA: hypothetical protein VIQ28_01830 [Burkholderiales bacterium]